MAVVDACQVEEGLGTKERVEQERGSKAKTERCFPCTQGGLRTPFSGTVAFTDHWHSQKGTEEVQHYSRGFLVASQLLGIEDNLHSPLIPGGGGLMPGGGIPIGAPRPGGIPIGGPMGGLMPGGGPIIPSSRERSSL